MAQELLESLLQRLLPTTVVAPIRTFATAPSGGYGLLVQPPTTGKSRLTEMEILLQNLLPVGSSPLERPPPAEGRRD